MASAAYARTSPVSWQTSECACAQLHFTRDTHRQLCAWWNARGWKRNRESRWREPEPRITAQQKAARIRSIRGKDQDDYLSTAERRQRILPTDSSFLSSSPVSSLLFSTRGTEKKRWKERQEGRGLSSPSPGLRERGTFFLRGSRVQIVAVRSKTNRTFAFSAVPTTKRPDNPPYNFVTVERGSLYSWKPLLHPVENVDSLSKYNAREKNMKWPGIEQKMAHKNKTSACTYARCNNVKTQERMYVPTDNKFDNITNSFLCLLWLLPTTPRPNDISSESLQTAGRFQIYDAPKETAEIAQRCIPVPSCCYSTASFITHLVDKIIEPRPNTAVWYLNMDRSWLLVTVWAWTRTVDTRCSILREEM